MLDLEHLIAGSLNVFRDLVSMSGTQHQRPQDQHVQRSLQQFPAFRKFLGHDGRYSTMQW